MSLIVQARTTRRALVESIVVPVVTELPLGAGAASPMVSGMSESSSLLLELSRLVFVLDVWETEGVAAQVAVQKICKAGSDSARSSGSISESEIGGIQRICWCKGWRNARWQLIYDTLAAVALPMPMPVIVKKNIPANGKNMVTKNGQCYLPKDEAIVKVKIEGECDCQQSSVNVMCHRSHTIFSTFQDGDGWWTINKILKSSLSFVGDFHFQLLLEKSMPREWLILPAGMFSICIKTQNTPILIQNNSVPGEQCRS